MIWTIIGILILLWIIGLITKVAGGLIHLLLIAALVVLIFRMLRNPK
ncbi:lmo0937 family membrane protein [Bacillus chungangensis]|uniref:Lipid-binding transport protein (Tim44 family) n=1 Tax=Bacillus chungangensis TaxID=587633 RepID=A0ABT9WWI4_9BACI|nr:lmo0937 family membrane protein [Bacillus chungangensis]MDQ0177590.1 putative lipid-binding transport protein (Tim44 family) [Bacillus chungangensis]